MHRRLTCVLVLAALVALLAPAGAGAYVVGGDRWPGATISYRVAARGYAREVDHAARIWNHAGVGAHLVRASRASAEVTVVYGGRRCEGESPMGWGGFRAATLMHLGAGCPAGLITLTAVHEFGHVLGLDHEYGKCARMNWSFSTTGTPTYCRPHPVAFWLRHPLEADDIAGARAIYRATSDPGQPWNPRGSTG